MSGLNEERAKTLARIKGERDHRWVRAWERYGLLLGNADFRAMERKIQDLEARMLYKPSKRRGIFAVTFCGRELPVVYNRRTHQIMTVLPPAALTQWKKPAKEPAGETQGGEA